MVRRAEGMRNQHSEAEWEGIVTNLSMLDGSLYSPHHSLAIPGLPEERCLAVLGHQLADQDLDIILHNEKTTLQTHTPSHLLPGGFLVALSLPPAHAELFSKHS